MIKPLLFMPSPRDIPAVKKLWHEIPYDKFIVKYKQEKQAYALGKEFFLKNTDYTHLIICPDDLEVTPEAVEQLISDVKQFGYETISGYCNLDEVSKDTYAIQPMGRDFSKDKPHTTKESWYSKDNLPEDDIIQVGHTGFACQLISRKLFEKLSWIGSSSMGAGNFDWQFSKNCFDLSIPIMVDTRVKLWHRRKEQYDRVNKYKHGEGFPDGYSFLLK